MKNHSINTSFVSPGLRPHLANKTGINLVINRFPIRRNLSIIRCDKWLFYYLWILKIYLSSFVRVMAFGAWISDLANKQTRYLLTLITSRFRIICLWIIILYVSFENSFNQFKVVIQKGFLGNIFFLTKNYQVKSEYVLIIKWPFLHKVSIFSSVYSQKGSDYHPLALSVKFLWCIKNGGKSFSFSKSLKNDFFGGLTIP